MAKKTGRVTKKRAHTTPRDLRSTKATVKGGAYAFPGFAGGVRVAAGDVDNQGTPDLKLKP